MNRAVRPQTITEKIIARHAGERCVEPGQFVMAKVDLALSNDVTSPLAIKQLENICAPGAPQVWNRSRIAIVLDHFTPNKDIASAEQNRYTRRFAREQKIRHFFDGCRVGIEHALLPEQGLVGPGDVVIGADSHTCTYGALGAFSTGVGSTDLAAVWATGTVWLKVPAAIKFVYHGRRRPNVYGKDLILETIRRIGVDGANYRTIELTGDAIKGLSMAGRFAMANMAIECGAKNGIIAPDAVTAAYLRTTGARRPAAVLSLRSDPDARYEAVHDVDVSAIRPQVALPHLPENSVAVRDLKRRITIDQAVIGSCTNGWYEDLVIAARVLKGRKVHPYVRALVFPATPAIYRRALKDGVVATLLDAGCIISPPTCGPCLGGHMGILAEGERAIATTNRNFVGRMGHTKSEVYLSNPAVAAYSAVRGYIAEPPA
jgi:3-isopropylmalate/(R)-2-methylmalate dehydratase large subunit